MDDGIDRAGQLLDEPFECCQFTFLVFFSLSLFRMSNIRHKLENDDGLVWENEDRPVRPVLRPANSSKWRRTGTRHAVSSNITTQPAGIFCLLCVYMSISAFVQSRPSEGVKEENLMSRHVWLVLQPRDSKRRQLWANFLEFMTYVRHVLVAYRLATRRPAVDSLYYVFIYLSNFVLSCANPLGPTAVSRLIRLTMRKNDK